MQFTNHFKDGLDVIPSKKRENRNKIIHGRGLVPGPQECICYLLLIDLESKCLKQQCILACVILDFAKHLECEGPHNIVAQNVICMFIPENSYQTK